MDTEKFFVLCQEHPSEALGTIAKLETGKGPKWLDVFRCPYSSFSHSRARLL